MNILLIDDHAILRSGVRAMIERYLQIETILEAGSLSTANDILSVDGDVDIIVLDLGLPDSSGFDSLTHLRSLVPSIPVIVLSGLTDTAHRQEVLRRGAAAFVAKDSDAFAILSAIEAVAFGETYAPAAIGPAVGLSGLSERQREILQLCCERLSNKEIGRRLGISDNTVRSHLAMLFRRFGVTSRTALAALASERLRSLPPPQPPPSLGR